MMVTGASASDRVRAAFCFLRQLVEGECPIPARI